MTPEEAASKALLPHVEAQPAPIQFNQCMACPRGWYSCLREDQAADFFVQVGRILNRIVQVNLVRSVKPRARFIFCARQRKAGLAVDRTKAAHRSFEV